MDIMMSEHGINRIILASKSISRKTILYNAGLRFDVIPSEIDERAVEEPLLRTGFSPEDIALVLAEAKAETVSMTSPDSYTIGADQILEFEGERITKPDTMKSARRLLLRMRGKTHHLHSAVAVARRGEVLWTNAGTAHLTMREYSPEFVGRYLAQVGEEALTSVGAYRIEGLGIHLFEKIGGDYFTILGIPLLPLLKYLREHSVIDL